MQTGTHFRTGQRTAQPAATACHAQHAANRRSAWACGTLRFGADRSAVILEHFPNRDIIYGCDDQTDSDKGRNERTAGDDRFVFKHSVVWRLLVAPTTCKTLPGL
jgi:hypothetical protein